jgi:hypothetical protein
VTFDSTTELSWVIQPRKGESYHFFSSITILLRFATALEGFVVRADEKLTAFLELETAILEKEGAKATQSIHRAFPNGCSPLFL